MLEPYRLKMYLTDAPFILLIVQVSVKKQLSRKFSFSSRSPYFVPLRENGILHD